MYVANQGAGLAPSITLATELRDAVVVYHERICAPNLVDDDTMVGATYGLLADATRERLSLDEWMRRLLEDRVHELQARLDLIGARVGEQRVWWRRAQLDLDDVIDHRTGVSVVEVDVVIVDAALAAASVVLVLGDYPLRLTDQCWWVRERGRWAATECAVGPAAAAEFGFPEQAEGAGLRWVRTDRAGWEETRRA